MSTFQRSSVVINSFSSKFIFKHSADVRRRLQSYRFQRLHLFLSFRVLRVSCSTIVPALDQQVHQGDFV